MRSETIELADISDRDVEAWRDLADRALEPNPFFDPDYILPLARALDQVDAVRLAICRDDDGWQFCLPFHAPRSWHRLPLPAVSTWRGQVFLGLLGTPLVGGGDPAAALGGAVAELRRPRAAFLALEWLGCGRVTELLDDELRRGPRSPQEFERFERAAVHRRPEPTYLDGRVSAKHRRELRRQRRKLGEELGAAPELVDRSQSEEAYHALVALEAAGRKGEIGTVLAADPAQVRFFVDMCRAFARRGRLQLLELRCGERAVATICNLLGGDTIFSLKIAYDETWSAFSPGILLLLDTLNYFHERTEAKCLDSCADPSNSMINRLWPDRRTLVSEVVPGPGGVGLLAAPTLHALRAVRDGNRARSERRALGG